MKRFVTSFGATVAVMAATLTVACDGGKDSTDGKPVGDSGDDPVQTPQLWVNEVMASNESGLQDEVGSFPDWIEIYNPNDDEVALGGWYLTDDVDEPMKWRIPDGIVVPASGFLVFFADSDTEEGDLHTSFNLSADQGEDVALFGPIGADNPLIDSVEDMSLAVPDVAIARKPDGGPTWEIEADSTPGASNG